jgi:GT2 family glycosyltransferase
VTTPLISVLIPTHNRAELLVASLESLVRQSLPPHQYEVVVIDDGSTDATPEVCQEFSSSLDLGYFRLDKSGIAAAKNLGVFASSGSILLFFDDDDIADGDLLREHLEMHVANPDQATAVLGYTEWAPSLHVSEVMRHVTDVGHFLFSYTSLEHGQVLDFTYFWGGRSSCKRALLANHGVFNQGFRFGSEDIELGYRLTRFGFKVIYNRQAIQYMNRATTYDEFCHRCERQGRSQVLFADLHRTPVIREYCQVVDAHEKWRDTEPSLQTDVARVHELEALLHTSDAGEGESEEILQELHILYRRSFDAFKLKGIVEANGTRAEHLLTLGVNNYTARYTGQQLPHRTLLHER